MVAGEMAAEVSEINIHQSSQKTGVFVGVGVGFPRTQGGGEKDQATFTPHVVV